MRSITKITSRHANFLLQKEPVFTAGFRSFLCKVTDRFTSHELALKLLRNNILVKDCGTKKAFDGKDYIRIAVRDRKDNDCVVEAIKGL